MAVLVLLCQAHTTKAMDGDSDHGAKLDIKNPQFAASKDDTQLVEDWKFEAVKLRYRKKLGSPVKREEKAKGEAFHSLPTEGDGVLIEGTSDLARGDLVSAPLSLEPFRFADVTIEYVVESGTPLVLACLRPTDDRALVDLEFLPTAEVGTRRRETLRLHTGRTRDDYSIAVSLVGKGRVRFLGIGATHAGAYQAPDSPVVVIDLMHAKPRSRSPYGWDEINRLVSVFGFSEVRFVHPFNVTREEMDAIDPALVVLSPTGSDMRRNGQNLDRGKWLAGLQAAADYGVPVVGICAGHQMLAVSQGAQLGGLVDKSFSPPREIVEWGPTEIEIETDDPVFAGLPRYPKFRAVQAHRTIVHSPKKGENLAISENCDLQVFRYPNTKWYTFQAHIEADWEYSCPESQLIWKNLLRKWMLVP